MLVTIAPANATPVAPPPPPPPPSAPLELLITGASGIVNEKTNAITVTGSTGVTVKTDSRFGQILEFTKGTISLSPLLGKISDTFTLEMWFKFSAHTFVASELDLSVGLFGGEECSADVRIPGPSSPTYSVGNGIGMFLMRNEYHQVPKPAAVTANPDQYANNAFGFSVRDPITNKLPALAASTWHHIAMVVTPTDVNYFVNGIRVTAIPYPNIQIAARLLTERIQQIGARHKVWSIAPNGTKTEYVDPRYPRQEFTGQIAKFRILDGTALYTTNFTPA